MPPSDEGPAPAKPKRKFRGSERTDRSAPKGLRSVDVIGALRASRGVVSAAARQLGCTAEALRARILRSPELIKVQKEITEESVDYCEEKLFKLIDIDDFRAVSFFLKTRGKHRGYSEKVEVDANVEVQGKIVLHLPKRDALPKD